MTVPILVNDSALGDGTFMQPRRVENDQTFPFGGVLYDYLVDSTWSGRRPYPMFEINGKLLIAPPDTLNTMQVYDPTAYKLTHDGTGTAFSVSGATLTSGTPEVQTVQCVAAAAIDGTYFTLGLADGAGGETIYAFWYDVDNSGTAQPVGITTETPIEITTVTTGMTAAQVAGVTAAAINAVTGFTAPAPGADTITVTNSNDGNVSNGANGAQTPGFTFANVTQGNYATSIYLGKDVQNRLYHRPVTGNHAVGETITPSIGTGSRVVFSAPSQSNGGNADTGEFIYEGAPSGTIGTTTLFRYGQPFAYVRNDAPFVGWFVRYQNFGTTYFAWLIYDPLANTMTPGPSLAVGGTYLPGRAIEYNNDIFQSWQFTSSAGLIYRYRASSNVIASVAVGDAYNAANDMFVWKGRLFYLGNGDDLGTNRNAHLYEFSGGAFTTLQATWGQVVSDGAVIESNRVSPASASGTLAVVVGRSLYAFNKVRNSAGSTFGWTCSKFHLDTSGAVVRETPNDLTDVAFIRAILGASDTRYYGGGGDTTEFDTFWDKVHEQKTAFTETIRLWYHDAMTTGNVEHLRWDGPNTLAQTYTWNGTTTVTAGAAQTELAVGDYIAVAPGAIGAAEVAANDFNQVQFFKISAVATTTFANDTLTISNPQGLTIPNTGGAVASVGLSGAGTAAVTPIGNAITSVAGPSANLRNIALPHSQRTAGIHMHQPGDYSGMIVNMFPTPGTPGSMRLTFRITNENRSGSAGTNVKFKFYYSNDQDNEAENLCTISAVQAGVGLSVAASVVTADKNVADLTGGTNYYADWTAQADGIANTGKRTVYIRFTP